MAIIIQSVFALGHEVSLTELWDKGILAEFQKDSLKIKNIYGENCIIIRGTTGLAEEVKGEKWKTLYPNDVLFWGKMGKFGIFVITAEAEIGGEQKDVATLPTNSNHHHKPQNGRRSGESKGFRRRFSPSGKSFRS